MTKFLGVLIVLVAALMAAGCDYVKDPVGAKAASPEPTQSEPADECKEDIDCPAGFSCDQGECVAKIVKPEPTPEPDTFEGEPDTETPSTDTEQGEPDVAAPPEPDTTVTPPGPDTSVPSPDTTTPSPDTIASQPDVEVPQPDTQQPGPDTIQPSPDTIQTEPDTETPSPDVEAPEPDAEQGGEDTIAPSPDVEQAEPDVVVPSGADTDGDAEAQPDAEPDVEPACVPVDEICGNAIDEDCDGEDVPCPPPVAKVTITVEDPESTALSVQTDITATGPYGWETIQDTNPPFGWELEIGESDSESELYRLNIFREPDGDWLCSVPGGGIPTCLILPTLSVDGETVIVESYTDRVIIPAGVAAVFEDPRYPDGNVANIGYCRGLSHCEIDCVNGEDDDGDGLTDLADPHCN